MSRSALKSVDRLRLVINTSRKFSSEAAVLPNAAPRPKYTLATVRSFPSLEPNSFIPVSANVLSLPLRRDILWQAVVYENDKRRVGASNPPGRSDKGFSRKKLLPQKGSGKARVGDANSPIRHNGGRALARTAPNDYSTELNKKVYSTAFFTALSHQYKLGNLFVIGKEGEIAKNDVEILDIDLGQKPVPSDKIKPNKMAELENEYCEMYFKKFLAENNLFKQRLLFVTNEPREKLLHASDKYKDKIDIIQKEHLEVNDILRAGKIYIELEALKGISEKYMSYLEN
ncbi:54S ribosomal protein YmL6, mitochondrial [Nakaseomyces glabratus]|uniref:Large ribosomal subunit protein uL4m n=1 Tax=Candida glabrata TaxID=5478 RepID=A0A0W0D5T0_CANGB|nr:Ribosomal protein L4/L1 family [Nakaseomyces glabratus]KAH7593388.1 Ribosomal protein L4/L1 family [Nakaseomyces glabratus]KTA96156.1 54S ribosomal protein YmL6, mitochondrial [Nakaseomyces glabratus]KTB07086.1 54S ribosomal protein YmL6, mitochondrial [Nakaseomyces glabratus]KTB07468.1 54S ribosomal protein YmL6, mitochondrial [Nakaseomyces glabratus]